MAWRHVIMSIFLRKNENFPPFYEFFSAKHGVILYFESPFVFLTVFLHVCSYHSWRFPLLLLFRKQFTENFLQLEILLKLFFLHVILEEWQCEPGPLWLRIYWRKKKCFRCVCLWTLPLGNHHDTFNSIRVQSWTSNSWVVL